MFGTVSKDDGGTAGFATSLFDLVWMVGTVWAVITSKKKGASQRYIVVSALIYIHCG